MDGGKDLPEDAARYSHLCQLECDFAGMAHNPRPDFDQTALNACERPVSDVLRQLCASQEVAELVGQGLKLEPDLVVPEPFAGQARPVDRAFASHHSTSQADQPKPHNCETKRESRSRAAPSG